MSRRRVGEHLRDRNVYTVAEQSIGQNWKRRLLARHTPSRALMLALHDGPSLWILVVSVAVPFLCATALIAGTLGLFQPADWMEKAYVTLGTQLPAVGFKEALLFSVCVAMTTLLLRLKASY